MKKLKFYLISHSFDTFVLLSLNQMKKRWPSGTKKKSEKYDDL